MAIVGESRGLFPVLKQWVQEGRPVRLSELSFKILIGICSVRFLEPALE